ncbi:MAG: hypothetical protein A4E66_01549 [Syntrophus sp. PtaB.Bin001]|nr:MAG: hypothetical protein A4E66_01549 [Syntrophus sp. PtaB.Bin001]
MYSLGNFFFPSLLSINGRLQPSKKESRKYLIVQSDFTKVNNFSYVIKGGWVTKNYAIRPYLNEESRRFTEKIAKLTAPILSQDYSSYWETYQAGRIRELRKESLKEAFWKCLVMPKRQLFSTIRFADIRRNIDRICTIIKN